MAINLLIAIKLLLSSADGEWATLQSCASIGAYNALLYMCIPRLMQPARVLTMGTLVFPSGREAHYGVLLADISSPPSVQTIPS